MRSFKTGVVAFGLGLSVCGYSHDVLAHSTKGAPGDLKALSAGSALIVQGTVSKVVYKMSLASADGSSRAIPFTFVTYRISKVLSGAHAESEVTLRFIGGSDGRGGFLTATGVPVFQAGEEDILFIANNGENGCALVMCEHGRYRVLNGAVYNTYGSPVVSVANDRASAGGRGPSVFNSFSYPAPSFDDLMQNPQAREALKATGLSLDAARTRHDATAPRTITIGIAEGRGSGAPVRDAGTEKQGLAVAAFTAAAASAGGGVTRAAVQFRNANVAATLVAPSIRAAAPIAPPQQAARALSAEDAAEMRDHPMNDPAPVIRKD